MPEEVYRDLAQRLDAIPNGFPATESGVELRLLRKIFSPEEARLASVMRLTHEPAADIAARAGVDLKAARRTLKQMVRRGQILAGRGKGQLTFALWPFIVGIYEEQLPRMDKEMAELVEQFLQETRGSVIFRTTPAIHRVIPVEEAVPVDIEVYPYERASELIDNAKAWGVRDCLCRVQRRLVGEPCDHPVENCLLFAPVEGAFAADEATRAITREEALRILREAREAGLVHTTGNYQDRRYYYGRTYICNCCTCSCGILRSVAEFGVRTAVAHSDFRANVDEELCSGCGTCLDRCQFGALSVPDDVCLVHRDRCMGCGLCVSVCPVDALSLHRLPAEETLSLPATRDEWMAQRAEARGIEIEAVL